MSKGLYYGLWGLQRNRECYDSVGCVCGTWAELQGLIESEGAVERTLGRDRLSGHSGVVLIVVDRILECS